MCVSPSGPFPSGVAPFYPFFISPESQRLSEQNAQTPTSQRVAAGPISTAVPINSFRTPTGAANGDVGSSRKNARSRGQITDEDGHSNVEIIVYANCQEVFNLLRFHPFLSFPHLFVLIIKV